MKKLIKYLSQYEHENSTKLKKKAFFWDEQKIRYHYLKIISIEFWFIKWLTATNKIDKDKMRYAINNYFDDSYFGFATYEYLVMICNVQDKPLSFLDSLLK